MEEMERAKREEEAAAAAAASAEGESPAGPEPPAPRAPHVAIEVTAASQAGGPAPGTAIPLTESESPRPGGKPEGSRPGSEEGVGELEITPVSQAIARYLGIDLSGEGKAARNRRGIAVIVNGPPLSGKTNTAIRLAKQYQAALLTVDRVIIEAIANGNTPAGLRARERCAEAAKRAEEAVEAEEGGLGSDAKKPGLSMEAVAAHTQGATDLRSAADKEKIACLLTKHNK